MAEHKKADPQKQEKCDAVRHSVNHDSQALSQSLMAWDSSSYLLGYTPFEPPMQTHAEAFSRASSKQKVIIARQLQQTYGNQYVQRLITSMNAQAKLTAGAVDDSYEHEADRVAEAITKVSAQVPKQSHDTRNETKRVRINYRMNTILGSHGSEMTIEPPGGGAEEEKTVPPGGPGPDTEVARNPSFFKCTPTDASIKNVTKYTSGKLYGHKFDFVAELTYEKLDKTATANKDAKLEWWEKCSRPPSWQGLTPNTWNDMYALFPTSPTFNGWKNRTKPCPGKETATINDPPATNVNLPARTLGFNLKVIGGSVTKAATGKQVLEPDGKGGIKTQDFTVP